MVEFLADLALALETVEQHRIGFHFRMRNLDRDLAAVAHIGGAKDRRHAAAGDQSFDAVVVKLFAGMKCHVVRGNALAGASSQLAQLIRTSPIHSHAFHASNSD